MNKMIIAGMTVLSLAAQAQQTSSTTLPAPASQTQTTTTSLEAAKPAVAKKWSAGYVNELNTNMQGQKDDGRDSTVTSYNAVSVGYKMSDKNALKLVHQFEFNSVPKVDKRAPTDGDTAAGGKPGLYKDGYMTLDPYIAFNRKVGSIMGSADVVVSNRYYASISDASVNFSDVRPASDKRNGMLRFLADVMWNVTPKVDFSVTLDPRINLNPETSKSSASARGYLNVYYNVSDAFQVYQSLGVLTGVGSITEGRKTSENGYSETGMNWTANKTFTFTAYLASLVALNSGGIDRMHSAENIDYGLVTSIAF